MKCNNCQQYNDESASYCLHCGTALERSPQARKGRLKFFAAGFFTGVAVLILGVMGIAFWWTSPLLAVTWEIPASAKLGGSFSMDIVAFNPHSELATLDNVDIPDAFFELFEVVSVTPTPSEDSPVGGFGTKTWYFDLEIPSSTTETITFQVRPTARGRHVIEFEVCNATEDCSLVAGAIQIE